MDLAFGAATLMKAAVSGPQALFGTQMRAATSLMTSIETLKAGQQFLRLQEGQHIATMNRSAVAQQRQQAQAAAETNYHQAYTQGMAREGEVMAHERAHQMAAGSFGGGIHLDYHTQQIRMADGSTRQVRYAAGGHVNVHMPSMPSINRTDPAAARSQLTQAMSAFQQVRGAAVAPHSPSSQDMAVAAGAQARLAQVQATMAQLNHQPQQNKLPSDERIGRRLNVVG